VENLSFGRRKRPVLVAAEPARVVNG